MEREVILQFVKPIHQDLILSAKCYFPEAVMRASWIHKGADGKRIEFWDVWKILLGESHTCVERKI